ncbi:MAG: efflux RND transporter periplasmic adaptor subunit [Candidatus Binatia bacterium]
MILGLETRFIRRFSRGLVLLVALSGCGSQQCEGPVADEAEPAAETHAGEEAEAQRAVRLDSDTQKEFGIEVATAGPGWVEKSTSLPAEVRPNQDRLAHIAPRFPGIAREVHAQIGDVVKAGQQLALIESEALAAYPLKTLIDGLVIAKHITRGEPVSREQAAFVVADLRDVWVDISVYQKDLPLLRLGQPVVISAGHGLEEAEGTISYIAPVVDEETRTATARVVLPNPEGVWRPGLFVTARVEVERREMPVAVPKTALEVLEGRSVVFVENEAGFEPRAVNVGLAGDRHVEIRAGLAAGERYVARGAFTLKAELQRGELAGGHEH